MLVVLEGIDGSGKGTQAQKLCQELSLRGHDVHLFSFPRYTETHFGKCVGEYLDGKFGTLDRVHPKLAATLYAVDRYESRTDLESQLAVRDFVVCDRYVPSNVAHQCARLPDDEAEDLRNWLAEIEFGLFKLPVPDLVIQLDLSVKFAQQLIAKKAGRDYTDKDADLHEADADYLGQVRKWYSKMSGDKRQAVRWEQVSVERNGHIRPIEDVAADVWNAVDREV